MEATVTSKKPQWQEDAEACADGLMGLWRSIDGDFKSKYALDIWRIFEGRIRTAAMQNHRLVTLVDRLCRNLQTDYGKNEKLRDQTMKWIHCGQDHRMLTTLRHHTTYVVALIREQMKAIKEKYEDEYGKA